MPIPTTTKNNLLTGQTITHASLHTDFPGATGAHEVVGSAYVRASITLNAAAGGQRTNVSSAVINVPPTTIRWVGFWNDATFAFASPNGGGTPRNFTSVPEDDGVAVADRVYCPAHGWPENQSIVFYGGTPPAPLTEGTVYYVRDPSTHTFKVSATASGSIIALAAAPSFGCVVTELTEAVYATNGVHRIDTATIAVAD